MARPLPDTEEARLFIGILDGNVVPIAESSNRRLLLLVVSDILAEYRRKESQAKNNVRSLVYGSQHRRLVEIFTSMGLLGCAPDEPDCDPGEDDENIREQDVPL